MDEQISGDSECFLEFHRDPHLDWIFYCVMKAPAAELKAEMNSSSSDVVVFTLNSPSQVAWGSASRW